jgi:hypothetical protein
MYKVLLLTTTLLLATTALATDERDRPAHFKGTPSETLEAAVTNFRQSSQRLATLTQQDLSQEQVLEVHEITYTLENAIARMQKELEQVAEALEQVHLASEQQDGVKVRALAPAYLEAARPLMQ